MGASGVARLTSEEAEEDFPGGRALIHAEHDSFGFTTKAIKKGMFTKDPESLLALKLRGQHHNEVLFRPKATVEALKPWLFGITD